MSPSTIGLLVAGLIFCVWSYKELGMTAVVASGGRRSTNMPNRVLLALISSIFYTLGTCAALVLLGTILGLLALILLATAQSDVSMMLQDLAGWPW